MGFGNILDLQFLLLWLSSGKMNHTLGKVYYPWGSRTMKDSSGKNSITIIKSWYYFFRINLFFFSVIIVPLHFARTVCYTLTLIFCCFRGRRVIEKRLKPHIFLSHFPKRVKSSVYFIICIFIRVISFYKSAIFVVLHIINEWSLFPFQD